MFQKYENAVDQSGVANQIDVTIYKILTTKPCNQSEKQIFMDIWKEHADVIVGAGEGDIFHNLHLELSLLAA